MMKPNVEKILREVQLISKRMRNRDEVAEELTGKLGSVQSQLEAMRQFREELMEYEVIAQRAEKSPRKQLILCLAVENKQLEQLKMQNKTLQSSLEEHQLALEMIMSKYREQISSLMHTNETEKQVEPLRLSASDPASKAGNTATNPSSFSAQERAFMDERLTAMAAIAQEVAEQSEVHSAELEMELHRLHSENVALREILYNEAGSQKTTKTKQVMDNVNNNVNNNNTDDDDGNVEQGVRAAFDREGPVGSLGLGARNFCVEGVAEGREMDDAEEEEEDEDDKTMSEA